MGQFSVEREIGGRMLRIETGKLAKQSAGTALVTYGETVVFGAIVTGPAREGTDFFPLTVDYREKLYAAGKFPGGFFKREARPTQKEILTMRMIDRPIRPMFPKAFRDEVLIQTMVLSTDQVNDPDILAMNAASAALSVSHLPFDGPTASCRIAYIDNEYVLNPTQEQMEYSTLEIVLAGRKGSVNMIEMGGLEVSEEVVSGAIKFGHEAIIAICEMIEDLKKQAGKPVEWTPPPSSDELFGKIRDKYAEALRSARATDGKQDRYAAVNAVYGQAVEEFCSDDADSDGPSAGEVKDLLNKIEKKVLAEELVRNNKRSDGRGATDIRQIDSEVGVLPRVHGSSVFQRGETQSLCVATLGTGRDEQIVDGLNEEYSKKFMLHYNFPPFCVGEVRRLGATSRREIGHGNLAEKALEAVLPTPDKFPYTIRLVSEIFESNGSSSMASVCAGCLALMDAGVPIKQPVAGISVGMVEADDQYKMIIDILGEEDHFGEMDFKVAGTQRGITAIQVDLKAEGLPHDMIMEAMMMAKDARLEILRKMLGTLSAPRKETSEFAPRILTIKVDPEKIGKVIGPGGKYIKSIEAETAAKVEIEDDGTIRVASIDSVAASRAIEMIDAVTAEVKVGKIYTGKVTSVKDFGAFIEVLPGQDGLCHISELDTGYVKSVGDIVDVGETVRVKVILIDDQGRIKLSRKAAAIEEGEEVEPAGAV